MNKKSIVLAAAVLGLLSTSAFATTIATHGQSVAALKIEAPAPVHVVSPAGLPRSAEGATVMLRMTIDESGQPSNIRVMSTDSRALTHSLVSAVSQWKFSPARQNGKAIPAKILLPLELASDNS